MGERIGAGRFGRSAETDLRGEEGECINSSQTQWRCVSQLEGLRKDVIYYDVERKIQPSLYPRYFTVLIVKELEATSTAGLSVVESICQSLNIPF